MKKLLTILFLIVTQVAISQGINTGFNFVGISRAGTTVTGTSYNARALDFFTRVETATSKTFPDSQKVKYNKIFQRLIDSALIGATVCSLCDSLDAFYLFPKKLTGDTIIGKLNLIKDLHNITNNYATTWTDSGYYNWTNQLDMNYNPAVQGVAYTINSGSFGVYSKTTNVRANCDIGIGNFTQNDLYITLDANRHLFRFNSSSNYIAYTPAVMNSKGFFALSRLSASNVIMSKNGAVVTDTTLNVVAFPTYAGSFIGDPGATQRVYSSAFIGSGLSADKIRKLSNIINEALREFGYNVY